jgi:thioredoxin-like negative regulator of GroEL
VLDDSNFDAQLAGKTAVVDFYATWCGHCQQLAPKWAAAAAEGAPLVFAKVDVDKAEVTSGRFNIEGLPTVLKVKGDRYIEFEGERSKEAILAFARTEHKDDDSKWKKVGEAAPKDEAGPEVPDAHSLVLDDSNFDAQLAGKTAVVDFYATWCGHCQQLAPKWAAAAAEGAPLVFAKVDVDKAEVTSGRFNIEGLPTVLKVKGDRYIEFEGERSKEAILAFARTEHKDDDSKWKKVGEAAPREPEEEIPADVPDTHSLVLDESNFDTQLAGKTAVVEFYAPWCGHCKALAPKWAAAAAEGAPLVFAKVDVDKAEGLGQRFNVEGFPTILKVFLERFVCVG